MRRGKFISIEGGEGAGKSTAMNCLREFITQEGHEVVWVREPGGTPLGEEIRNVLLHPKSTDVMQGDTELLLMFAARAQLMQQVIEPALQAGKWVVSDRFVDASYAYQGGGRGANLSAIKMLDAWIVRDCYPDLTILLDLPPEIGLQRLRNRQKDRIEKEQEDFFVRVREAYLARAKENRRRIHIVDASQSLSEVTAAIHHILLHVLSPQ